jgi:hypothetical protein
MPNCSNTPGPLRSRESPCVPLPHLTKVEVRSFWLGSLLAIVVPDLLARIGGYGGWVLLEHPADRGRGPYPSSFYTDMLSWVKVFLEAVILLLHQCRFEAPTVKPTMLLTTDKSLPRSNLLCNLRKRHRKLVGIDDRGHFCTTVAAIYTAEFCEFMARSAVAHMSLVDRCAFVGRW